MKPRMTLEECQNLLKLLKSDYDNQSVALRLLASNIWKQQGYIKTAIIESKFELIYRKQEFKYHPHGIDKCISALEKYKNKFS